jgi:hypothetical protein
MRVTKRLLLIPTLALLVACGPTQQGEPDAAATAETNAPPPVATNPPAPEEGAPPLPGETVPPPESPASSGVLKLGQGYTWADGITAIVTEIIDHHRRYDNTAMKVVNVQFQNNAGVPVDVSEFSANMTFGPAGIAATPTGDYEAGIEGFASGSIPPGGTRTVKFGFSGVTDPSKMVVEVRGWTHEPAFWQTP